MNEYLRQFSKREAAAASAANTADPETIALLDRLTACITHGVSLLDAMKNDRGQNFLVGLLLSRAFGSLRCGRQALVAGYPAPSVILARAALEEWATICWVEAHPESIDRWLWAVFPDIYSRPEGRVPSFNDMLKAIDDSDGYRNVYDVLSKFGHPRSEGFVFQASVSGAFHDIQFTPAFSAEGVGMGLRTLIPVAFVLLGTIERWQERVLGAADPDWSAAAKQFEMEVVVLLQGSPVTPEEPSGV